MVPMINTIVSKFQCFRNRLFQAFPQRAGATMDLIDAVCAETNISSIVKISLSDLFRRKYSSLSDVISSLFRTDLKQASIEEEREKQTLKVTQLLAEECARPSENESMALFAIDCTANPRIYAKKVKDRTIVHSPNHVPGQKPITVGHEYSALVHLPEQDADQKLHWVVPLSIKRVTSDQSGTKVGIDQLEAISNDTVFKKHLCVSVADSAYSTRAWVISVGKWSNVVHISRMRNNRKVHRVPHSEGKSKRGRPVIYGDEILLNNPSQPDLEEFTMITNQKGLEHKVILERWNDVVMKGSKDERTHEHPFDMVRIRVVDKGGKSVHRRPLWLMIAGAKRRKITSKKAYNNYGRRYDIEHFFRFGKQRLGLTNSQTCETLHEENWIWVGILAYNMLYHARQLTEPVSHPWEKRKIQVIGKTKRPSQVQRDYGRFIRGFGTPAPMPKTRGKSPGRKLGYRRGDREDQPLIKKGKRKPDFSPPSQIQLENKDPLPVEDKKPPKEYKEASKKYRRMRRIWKKNRPAAMRC